MLHVPNRITVRAVYTNGESCDSNPIVASLSGGKEEAEGDEAEQKEGEEEEEVEQHLEAPPVSQPSGPPETQLSGAGEDAGGGLLDQTGPSDSSIVDKQAHQVDVGGQAVDTLPPRQEEPDHPVEPEHRFTVAPKAQEDPDLVSVKDPSVTGHGRGGRGGGGFGGTSGEGEGDEREEGEAEGRVGLTEPPLARTLDHTVSSPHPNITPESTTATQNGALRQGEGPFPETQPVPESLTPPPCELTTQLPLPTHEAGPVTQPLGVATPPSPAIAEGGQVDSQGLPIVTTPSPGDKGAPKQFPPEQPPPVVSPPKTTPIAPPEGLLQPHLRAAEGRVGLGERIPTPDSLPASSELRRETTTCGDTLGTRPADGDGRLTALLSVTEQGANSDFDSLPSNPSGIQLPVISRPNSANCDQGEPTTAPRSWPTATSGPPEGETLEHSSVREGAQHVPALGDSSSMASLLLSQLESDLTATT